MFSCSQALTSPFTLLQRYPLMAKEVFFFADVCRSSHLYTNSRCTAAEIQPLDCNNDTTKQQELGNSCIVTKSPCHSLTVFLAVLVTQRQEVSTISKAGVLLGVVFVCLLGVFFLYFFLYSFFLLFWFLSAADTECWWPDRSLVSVPLHLGTCLTEQMNSHLFTCRDGLSAIQAFRQNTHPSLYLIQGFNRAST